jgi:hypothetical protein
MPASTVEADRPELAAVGQRCEGPSKAQADGSLRSAVLELKRGRAMVESARRRRERLFIDLKPLYTAIHQPFLYIKKLMYNTLYIRFLMYRSYTADRASGYGHCTIHQDLYTIHLMYSV